MIRKILPDREARLEKVQDLISIPGNCGGIVSA